MLPSKVPNLYDRLGVSEDASPEEIKKAFKDMAFQWHPDRNLENPNANIQFVAISEAYEVLSNPQKKYQYDSNREILSYRAQQTRKYQSKEADFDSYDVYKEIFDKLFEDYRPNNEKINYNQVTYIGPKYKALSNIVLDSISSKFKNIFFNKNKKFK